MVGNVPTCTDDIGWAFSRDDGKTWTHGLLPGLTRYSTPPGPGPSVAGTTAAWDARYKEWVVSALNCANPGGVTVSISKDGTHWSKPISVFKGTGRDISDKDWVTCDSHPASPHYGNCYAEWDMVNKGFQVEMSTSTDDGKTWSAPVATASKFRGVGGEPVVLPNGTVVVPIPALRGLVLHDGNLDVSTSTNGGRSWGATQTITTFHQYSLAGNLANLRLPFFPAEGVDRAGRIYPRVPRLPVPRQMVQRRHGHDHLDRRDTLEHGDPDPGGPGHQHGRRLERWAGGGPLDLRGLRPAGAVLLLLPEGAVHRLDLPGVPRLHLVIGQGFEMEHTQVIAGP
jgi:hypothetical protein